jgi:branched-chain amino acid transport system permease protein
VLGPIIGAFALIGLEELLKSSVEHWKLVKGLVIIALVFLLPGGLQQLGSMLRRQHGEGADAGKVPVNAKEAAING